MVNDWGGGSGEGSVGRENDVGSILLQGTGTKISRQSSSKQCACFVGENHISTT